MTKKIFGFNLEVELKARLDKMAEQEGGNTSKLLSRLITKAVDDLDGVVKVVKPKVIQHVQTEAERLTEWEWRKKMVAEGKFPIHMGNEYPTQAELDSCGIYATPDGLPSDTAEKIEKKKQTQEDADFDKSFADSMSEKTDSTQSLTAPIAPVII